MYTFRARLSVLFDREAVLVATLICLMVLTGCPSGQQTKARLACVEVLSDFVFVGSGPYDPKSVPSHEMKELSLPSKFQAGQQYVFHFPGRHEDANIYNRLLAGLRAKGIKITSSTADIDRYVGGPGFLITFQDGEFKGRIFNTLDGQILNNEVLAKQWSIDDYVLVLEEA